MAQTEFILASASVRRQNLLAQIGIIPDRIITTNIDETPYNKELPKNYALRIAEEKLLSVANYYQNHYILAADTVVACGRRILKKAHNDDEVKECLLLLSGRRHSVFTALYVASPGGERRKRIVKTEVQFKRLHEEEIRYYIESKEGIGKAGGYAIQGLAAAFIPWIQGSYSNVVGLPLYETAMLLNSQLFTMKER